MLFHKTNRKPYMEFKYAIVLSLDPISCIIITNLMRTTTSDKKQLTFAQTVYFLVKSLVQICLNQSTVFPLSIHTQ